VPVADDAQGAAADLATAGGTLPPGALVKKRTRLGRPSKQHDDLADGQLNDATGVAVRGVEDRDPAIAGRTKIDLLGANAEAADCKQAISPGQGLRRDLRLRANAQERDAPNRTGEFGFVEGVAQGLDAIALVTQGLGRVGVDVLQEKGHHPRLGKARRTRHLTFTRFVDADRSLHPLTGDPLDRRDRLVPPRIRGKGEPGELVQPLQADDGAVEVDDEGGQRGHGKVTLYTLFVRRGFVAST
jgi:hypothetical protein